MTIRSKLTIIFTLIVASILVLFSSAVYYYTSNTRMESVYLRLKNRATNTARRLTEKGLNIDLMKAMDKNTNTVLFHGSVRLYDSRHLLLYNSNDIEPLVTPSADLFKNILKDGEVRYHDGEKEALGILLAGHEGPLIAIASGLDETGLKSLHDLGLILIVGLIITIIFSALAGYLFSGQVLNPILNIVNQVGKIGAKNLNQRVGEGNGSDEIARLAIEFNRMLGRLEAAFEMQRSFVSNASHELRTPLTAMGGQIEIALMSKRGVEEYEKILHSLWDDIKNMNTLSNGLFDLAQASFDPSVTKIKNVRVDELIWQSRDELIRRQKEYAINVEYAKLPEDENKLTVPGNEYLLKTAIINIMDNACKYSPDKCVSVNIAAAETDNNVLLQFIDRGIGISEQDQEHIFEPFFRASNVRNISGHGIGLSLVEKIINLHKGMIRLDSSPGKGTKVQVTLPR